MRMKTTATTADVSGGPKKNLISRWRTILQTAPGAERPDVIENGFT
jgi:hypothetical protein